MTNGRGDAESLQQNQPRSTYSQFSAGKQEKSLFARCLGQLVGAQLGSEKLGRISLSWRATPRLWAMPMV